VRFRNPQRPALYRRVAEIILVAKRISSEKSGALDTLEQAPFANRAFSVIDRLNQGKSAIVAEQTLDFPRFLPRRTALQPSAEQLTSAFSKRKTGIETLGVGHGRAQVRLELNRIGQRKGVRLCQR
jgi:hypothetical protein